MSADLDQAERMLRLELAERLASTRALELSLADVRAARSDGTADDEHDPEGSTLSSDWSRLAGLSDDARHQAEQVERALARIADGTYGVCLRCGRPIAEARLEARPAAELCIDCARAQESRR